MKKIIILAIGCWLLAVGCGERKENGEKPPVRVKVSLLAPNHSSFTTYVGTVEEREATAVSFTSMGVVKRVLVSEGQAVARGQLIAEMDDTQARNMVQAAEAQMAQAEDALQRYSMLHDAGSLPEVQWVEIQSKVAQARSSLAVAKKNLADCRLTAPVSGIIGRKMVGAGETAMPSQAVVTILDISEVKVKVSVPESDMRNISEHTPSTIKVEAAGVEVAGGRIEKGVVADAMTHTYDLRIHVQNSGRQLLPGMVASVSFAATSQMVETTLPMTAVQRRADGSLFVWTVGNDNTAHRTTVTIGATTGNRVAITSGVEPEQRVVTEGYQKLSEGTKVQTP
jgi:RND family efflux transporter MFP subunit